MYESAINSWIIHRWNFYRYCVLLWWRIKGGGLMLQIFRFISVPPVGWKKQLWNGEKLVIFDNFFFFGTGPWPVIVFYLILFISVDRGATSVYGRINHNVWFLFVWRIKNYLLAEQFPQNLFIFFHFHDWFFGKGILVWGENGNWFHFYSSSHNRIYLRVYFWL